jgi:hypothetical protein
MSHPLPSLEQTDTENHREEEESHRENLIVRLLEAKHYTEDHGEKRTRATESFTEEM